MAATPTLSDISLRLRNAAPEIWAQFVAAFDMQASEVTVAVTRATPDQILIAQGRAQQMLSLLRTFEECDKSPRTTPAP